MPEAVPRELTFGQAVREALAEEMRRDSRVCIFGEDVAEAGTPFKVLSGLVEEFGTNACWTLQFRKRGSPASPSAQR